MTTRRPATAASLLLLALLGVALHAAVAAAGGGDGRSPIGEIADIKTAGVDDDSAATAKNTKFVEPLARFYCLPYFFLMALPIGYLLNLGPGLGLVCLAKYGLWFFVAYLIFATSTDFDLLVADYGVINARPLLTNHGALGGYITVFGAAMNFIGGLFTGAAWKAALRDLASASGKASSVISSDPRSSQYSHVYLENHFGPYFTRALVPASWCMPKDMGGHGDGVKTAEQGLDELLKPHPNTPLKMEDDGTMFTALVANWPGDRVRWGTFLYFIILVKMVEVAAHAGDVWTVGTYSWVGFAVLVVVCVVTMCTFPMYRYGDVVLFSSHPQTAFKQVMAHAAKHGHVQAARSDETQREELRKKAIEVVRRNMCEVSRHAYNRLELLWPLVLCLLVYWGGMCIFWTVMDASNEYTHGTIFAINLQEERTFARNPLKWEGVASGIIGGVLFFAGLAYSWAAPRVTAQVLVMPKPGNK